MTFYSPHESPYKVEKITSKEICCFYPSAKNPQVTVKKIEDPISQTLFDKKMRLASNTEEYSL